MTAEGNYDQLVGDHMVNVNRSQISQAIEAANKASQRRMYGAHFFVPLLEPAPVGIVKKRRILALA